MFLSRSKNGTYSQHCFTSIPSLLSTQATLGDADGINALIPLFENTSDRSNTIRTLAVAARHFSVSRSRPSVGEARSGSSPSAIRVAISRQKEDHISKKRHTQELLSEDTMSSNQNETQWDGTGTQDDFMKKDECILVDEKDVIIGHASKYQSHRFEGDQPSGLLHRAFSVFLFDTQDRLLLQQRAGSKITFPNVWTNTCCSHPLHGYDPPEVDKDEDIASGSVPGVKRAAIRKLKHELGIEGLDIGDFKYLTRLHYCARDEHTWGPQAEWGEHEMDYILFCKANVRLHPHEDEVQDTRYVNREQLKDMMKPESGLLWSPWFRIIADRFLDAWWEELDVTLTTDRHVDLTTIHSILKQ